MRVVVLGGHDRLKAKVEQMAKNISLKFINQKKGALACALILPLSRGLCLRKVHLENSQG
jgi:hypothetical protein